VHSASIGHPVLGDEKYGGESMRQRMGSLPSRLYLHARSIQFNLNEVTYHFQADADEKFMRGVASLRQIEE
jgi:23S rRNA pseudouridine955/2504/2580 synthase